MTSHESLPISDNQRRQEIESLESDFNGMSAADIEAVQTPENYDEPRHSVTETTSRIVLKGFQKLNLPLWRRVRMYNDAIDTLEGKK